ncbi:MAG: rhodanese-like domain-containing protein [Betaproteobacteria bacterium]|nr:rhodanese-like domain-containing protein [Betaproteobacteria bacterium]
MDFVTQNIWLVLLALLSGLMLVLPAITGKLSGILQISPQEAVRLFNHEDALILDVREASEYRDGHVPKSRHIPLGKLKDELSSLEKFKDRAIVAVCRSGNRSQNACNQLRRAGFTKLHNLAGGIGAWDQAGLPKER